MTAEPTKPPLELRRHTGAILKVVALNSAWAALSEGARFVLYLSPRAAEDCADLYYKDFPYEQSDKPDVEGQYVAERCGSQTARATIAIKSSG